MNFNGCVMLVSFLLQTEHVEVLAAELDTYKDKYSRSYRDRASLDAQLVETRG